jgi:hypothetical protein
VTKNMRSRVHLCNNRAIRRWIPLVDEIVEDDLVVSVFL